MKKKILALVLSMAVGISAFGLTARAAGARMNCPHPKITVNYYNIYDYANSVYHWTYEVESRYCATCDYLSETVSEHSYDEHDFSVYTNDGRYCSGCGHIDEFFY